MRPYEDHRKIMILGNMSESTEMLIASFKNINWEVDVIPPKHFTLAIDDKGEAVVYLKNKMLDTKQYAAVVPRISGENFKYGLMVLRHLQVADFLARFEENKEAAEQPNGVEHKLVIENNEMGLFICSDKLLTHQYLSVNCIKSPKTILTDTYSNDFSFPSKIIGLPFIAKKRVSSQGKGVFKVNDIETANSFLGFVDEHMILQEFMDLRQSKKEAASDIRAFYVGGNWPRITAYRRFALKGDWKTNYSISEKGEPIELTDEEKNITIKAATAVCCTICGVDLARTKTGVKVIECNGNPSLVGVTKITGKQVSDHIANFIDSEIYSNNPCFSVTHSFLDTSKNLNKKSWTQPQGQQKQEPTKPTKAFEEFKKKFPNIFK